MWWLIVFEKATETPVIDLVKNGEGIAPHPPSPTGTSGDGVPKEGPPIEAINEKAAFVTNKGKPLMDTTVAPQNITYPTDLKPINAAREKSGALIDKIYNKAIHGSEKVRTYREMARKDFLNAARKKAKPGKEIYKANSTQIRYLKRNLAHITTILLAPPFWSSNRIITLPCRRGGCFPNNHHTKKGCIASV